MNTAVSPGDAQAMAHSQFQTLHDGLDLFQTIHKRNKEREKQLRSTSLKIEVDGKLVFDGNLAGSRKPLPDSPDDKELNALFTNLNRHGTEGLKGVKVYLNDIPVSISKDGKMSLFQESQRQQASSRSSSNSSRSPGSGMER